jgi:glycosyltransferase involved in cell wall biosynthesis
VAHELELLRVAAERHDITVLSAFHPSGKVTLKAGDRELPLETVYWDGDKRRFPSGRLDLASQFIRGWPTHDQWVVAEGTRVLRRAVAGFLEREPVDLVHLTHANVAPVVAASRAPTALLLFDLLSRQLANEAALAESPQRRLRFALERRRTAAWEARWYARATGVASVSPTEADELGRVLGREVPVIPNPVADMFFEAPKTERSKREVTFVAHLGWRPNVDAVDWFVDEIWPRVIACVPDAELVVVGAQPGRRMLEKVDRLGGRVHADVADIRPYYWSAAVSIAPLRLGSGLSNKVLHALACGAPVVATTKALDGIPARPGEHVLAADDGETFANAVVACLEDPAAARARSARARPLVDAHRIEHIGELLEQWWQETARRRPTSAARHPRSVLPSSPPATATVILCTRNRPDLLRTSLPSLAAAVDRQPGTDLVIVEQGEPHAEAIARELGIEANVIRDDGRGVARARNIGAARARGDLLLFTDDDCEVPPSWVADHLSACLPGVGSSFGSVTSLSRFDAPIPDYDLAAFPGRFGTGTVPWRIGHSSNIAVRREVYLAAGGFDERLGPGASGGGDDPDMIIRLLRHGSAVTGVGQPVRHMGWRSGEDDLENIIVYERGAGMWIGKALRADPRDGLFYIRARLGLLRDRLRDQPGILSQPGPVVRSLIAFVAGLARGVRLGRGARS